MAAIYTYIGILLVLLTPLTATYATHAIQATNGTLNESHTSKTVNTTSRKRQEIIFLRGDSTHKRNREEETMTQMEKHGKTLSAEGKVFRGKPDENYYEDSTLYVSPGMKEQSASKYKGPPEIRENDKKSDAYEVIGDTGGDTHKSTMADEDTVDQHRVVRVHASDVVSNHVPSHHHRSGLHIVSLGEEDTDEGTNDDKDTRLYGSIGSPSSNPIRRRPHYGRHRHGHHRYKERFMMDPYQFLPQNVVSLSQDDFNGPFSRPGGHTRDEIFPSLERREPYFIRPQSPMAPSEEPMQGFRPLNPKSISYGDRPNLFLLPSYNGRSVTDPAILPMTAQSAFQAPEQQMGAIAAEQQMGQIAPGPQMGQTPPGPQMGEIPMNFPSPQSAGMFRNGLSLQSALQAPFMQTQSASPPFQMPAQMEPQPFFNSQQPDLRSLYQYQMQSPPQLQGPQVPVSPQAQSQPFIIPTSMQMEPSLLGSMNQEDIRPNRWVDENGQERSEVLNRQREPSVEDRSQDDRTEDEDDAYDDDNRHRSRYDDRDEESRTDDSDDDRDREDPMSDDERERSDSRDRDDEPNSEEDNNDDAEETDEEPNEEPTSRAYQGNGPTTEDEQNPNIPSPVENDLSEQEQELQRERFIAQERFRQMASRAMSRVMVPNRPYLPPRPPGYRFRRPTEAPSELDAQTFSRYQLLSPSSAVKEHILPKPPPEPASANPAPNTDHSNVKISQLSPAEAQFYENDATLDPSFAPPIASKDTIPRKLRRLRGGFGNVLIRLNGKPLESSAQLKSHIVDGRFVEGKGKMIKSKGPVRVKLSHTKDSKHLKIVDIIAPKQFQVYDTKSRIRRPVYRTNATLSEAKRRSLTLLMEKMANLSLPRQRNYR